MVRRIALLNFARFPVCMRRHTKLARGAIFHSPKDGRQSPEFYCDLFPKEGQEEYDECASSKLSSSSSSLDYSHLIVAKQCTQLTFPKYVAFREEKTSPASGVTACSGFVPSLDPLFLTFFVCT